MTTKTTDADATTRDRIRRIAFERFSARGYDGVSVRAVADACGVSPGVVTYHFKKKVDLYTGAIGPPYDRFVQQLQLRANDPGRTPAQRLRDVIDYVSDPGDETLNLLRLLLRQVMTSREPVAAIFPLMQSGHLAVLTKVIGEASRSGEVSIPLPGALPIILGGAVLPRLFSRSVSHVPAARAMLDVIAGDSKRVLLELLGLDKV